MTDPLAVTTSIRRIVVVTGDHGAPDPGKRGGRYNEEDLVSHRAMEEALRGIEGFEWNFWTDHTELLARLRDEPPDLVVNFCDTGVRNVVAHEAHLPAYLELLGIPYTGAPPAAIVTCYDKQVVRLVARELGVPVPRERFVAASEGSPELGDLLPALLKPNRADGSLGITQHAVVHTQEEAERYLASMRETLPGCDALAQEFLSGTEYGVGLIGNPGARLDALLALEVDYSDLPPGLAPILSYESKALPDSPYYSDIRYLRATLPPEREQELVARSKRLFQRLGLRDYGRFDFRTGSDGEIRLMEVNPNPAWANDAKLAFMAAFAGVDYRGMLRMLLDAALERLGERR